MSEAASRALLPHSAGLLAAVAGAAAVAVVVTPLLALPALPAVVPAGLAGSRLGLAAALPLLSVAWPAAALAAAGLAGQPLLAAGPAPGLGGLAVMVLLAAR